MTSKSGCGRRAEESVNEGTAQAEKASTGLLLFQKVAPSCIIFLTPLQEGLMTPALTLSPRKPACAGRRERGWPDMPRKRSRRKRRSSALNATEEVTKKR